MTVDIDSYGRHAYGNIPADQVRVLISGARIYRYMPSRPNRPWYYVELGATRHRLIAPGAHRLSAERHRRVRITPRGTVIREIWNQWGHGWEVL